MEDGVTVFLILGIITLVVMIFVSLIEVFDRVKIVEINQRCSVHDRDYPLKKPSTGTLRTEVLESCLFRLDKLESALSIEPEERDYDEIKKAINKVNKLAEKL